MSDVDWRFRDAVEGEAVAPLARAAADAARAEDARATLSATWRPPGGTVVDERGTTGACAGDVGAEACDTDAGAAAADAGVAGSGSAGEDGGDSESADSETAESDVCEVCEGASGTGVSGEGADDAASYELGAETCATVVAGSRRGV